MQNSPPELDKKFVCIVSGKEQALAAVISSYLTTPLDYLPVFEFPNASLPRPDKVLTEIDENYISVIRCKDSSRKISNAINLINSEYVILGGLNENQKSYLDFLPSNKVIEINSLLDAEFILSGFVSSKDGHLGCRSSDLLNGLFTAVKNGVVLKIDEMAEIAPSINSKQNGIIVIEQSIYVSSIIAVNYALAIGSDIALINKPNTDLLEIKFLIENWQNEGDERYFNDLSSILYPCVEEIPFSDYSFATFFTFGAPYSLILKNVIPFTYVNSNLSPDFFIFNNISQNLKQSFHSAVIFSPEEFDNEETQFVIQQFYENIFFVKPLLGPDASVYNIENYIKEFPFDVLHLCSHGGEVGGYRLLEEYIDRDGNPHLVEFDEVVTFAPRKDQELIQVTSKYIWRRFDGLTWKSKELREKGYPNYIFADMHNELVKKEKKNRKKIDIVPDSCSIKCADFNYQAMFTEIAGSYLNPFVFNNTCWSAYSISNSFIGAGVVGYIGTLWNVDNRTATEAAETFYKNLFNLSISSAFSSALEETKGSKDENIYIYWGLHFTRVQKGNSIEETRMKIAGRLTQSFAVWKDYLCKTKDENIKKQVQAMIDWNYNTLTKEFPSELSKYIKIAKGQND